ncbi:MAG: DNA repair protein RecO [Kiritimatiellia bacterium]
MIEKTEAIVLRTAPFSNTSRIVTWLTPAFGKVTTILKGACRPKSLFLGQYDLFYTCELLFYSRDRNGIHVCRECSPISARPSLRRNWKSAFLASYACGLTEQTVTEKEPHPAIYRHLSSALDCLAERPERLFIPWFETGLMRLAGVGPQLGRCAVCGSDTAPDLNRMYNFSFSRGGILCRDCAARDRMRAEGFALAGTRKSEPRPPGSTLIPAPILNLLRNRLTAATPALYSIPRGYEKSAFDFTRRFGMFLAYHLGLRVRGREFALQICNTLKNPRN